MRSVIRFGKLTVGYLQSVFDDTFVVVAVAVVEVDVCEKNIFVKVRSIWFNLILAQ